MTRKGDDTATLSNGTDIPPCNYDLRSDGTALTMQVLCREYGQRELKDRRPLVRPPTRVQIDDNGRTVHMVLAIIVGNALGRLKVQLPLEPLEERAALVSLYLLELLGNLVILVTLEADVRYFL